MEILLPHYCLPQDDRKGVGKSYQENSHFCLEEALARERRRIWHCGIWDSILEPCSQWNCVPGQYLGAGDGKIRYQWPCGKAQSRADHWRAYGIALCFTARGCWGELHFFKPLISSVTNVVAKNKGKIRSQYVIIFWIKIGQALRTKHLVFKWCLRKIKTYHLTNSKVCWTAFMWLKNKFIKRNKRPTFMLLLTRKYKTTISIEKLIFNPLWCKNQWKYIQK